MDISVIVPLYNEEAQLSLTVSEITKIMNISNFSYEIILIDDGSTDNTWKKIEDICAFPEKLIPKDIEGEITAISFSRNFGKESAICAGLNLALGDAAIVMDGDLQHPPEYIIEMTRIWKEENVDIVEGVKSKRNKDSLSQRINAFIFYKVFGKATGYNLTNASDFKLLDRKVIDEWKRLGEQDTFFRALSGWLGFKRKSFQFEVPERISGRSKWSLIKLFKLSVNAITSFSALPLQIVTIFGIIFLFFSIGLGIQTLIRWSMGTAADGFTTVILLLLFIGGAIMLSLGLIGIYIGRIFTEVKNRPRYIISKKIKS